MGYQESDTFVGRYGRGLILKDDFEYQFESHE